VLASLGLLGMLAMAPRPEPLPPLVVEFAGCSAVRAGPICQIAGEARLTLWLEAPDNQVVAVCLGTKKAATDSRAVEGGEQIHVVVPQDARELRIAASCSSGEPRFRLAIEPAAVVAEIAEAEALRQQHRLDEAEARLAGSLHHASAGVRAQALGKLARIERVRGHAAEAVQHFREAIVLDRETGRRSDELSDRFALSFTLVDERRFAEARAALDPGAIRAEVPEALASAAHYAANIAFETGDLRTSLRLLREADAGARRLDLSKLLPNVLELEAEVLRQLGRRAEAAALLREAQDTLGSGARACQKAQLLTSLGWFLIDDGKARESASASISPLEEAASLYRTDCPEPAKLSNALTNLAEARLALGEVERVRVHLDEARRAAPDPGAVVEAEWAAIEARVALSRADADRALELYTLLGEIAERALLPEARWQAALGRAEALEALDRVEDARAAYASAEHLLDDASLRVPLGEGKKAFLDRRAEIAQRRVDFLVRRGDAGADAEAAEAARRARARILIGVEWSDRVGALDVAGRERWEQRIAEYRHDRGELETEAAADWKLSSDKVVQVRAERNAREAGLRSKLEEAISQVGETPLTGQLVPPATGELLLVYHPAAHGWVGFALTDRGVISRKLGSIDPGAAPGELAKRLLEPFHTEIASAERLRVLPQGPLETVDFHALPFEGEPLVAHAPVAYGVDRPGRAPAPENVARTSALVVADPSGNLPAARTEARRVVSRLHERSVDPVVLQGREATHAAVRDAIERVGLFHYAGHGIFDEQREGWESGLPLAGRGLLSLGDVLALRRAPDLVLLSGCETARAPSGSSASGLGLAQAFVIAGAHAAVASSRPIDDGLAERMMTVLYGGLGRGLDASTSLREAQLAVRKEAPETDWAAFRILVP
jgi:cellulose synthase operon protein C